eukprot:PhF_6_TR22540/c0_g1_i1/m.32033/K01279/TPP1, CLN2; tripeptidyl-peptidase I
MEFLITLALVFVSVGAQRPTMHGWFPTNVSLEGRSLINTPTVHVTLRYAGANLALLEEELLKRSNPDNHEFFRQWLTVDQIKEIVAPKAFAMDREMVDSYFRPVAIRMFRSPHGDYLNVELPVKAASEIFQVSLEEFTHNAKPIRMVNTIDSPRLPKEIGHLVMSVHKLGEFFPIPTRRLPQKKTKQGEPGITNDPSTLRLRYNIGNVSGTGSTQQGVAEFEKEQFVQSNIDTFMAKYSLPKISIGVVGPNKGGYYGEGHLDLEYIAGLATNISTWWIAGNQFDLLTWAHEVENMTTVPSVLSISWGSGESGYLVKTANAVNAEFMKLGSMGVSIFASSGDDGTGSQGVLSCQKFDPNYPASLPYVTAVGGTYANTTSGPEIGWQSSGGGFSAVFTAPPYQTSAIAAYVKNTSLPPATLWTSGGRGTPDVSAMSTNFEVFTFGWGKESGTSAASPTFASVISLINDQRLHSGKPALGFLNPALYKLGKVGADPISGNNQYGSCPAGFSAAKGWDAITGLGTPDFKFLSEKL